MTFPVALGSGLLALLLARALAAFGPGMWLWGLDAQRFLDPLAAWGPWLLMAVSLVPAVARASRPALASAGDALSGTRMGAALAAGAAALLVGLLPDRAWFIGDFVIRQGAVEAPGAFAGNFVGAMPLDRLLHDLLPRWVGGGPAAHANLWARALGVLEAAALALGAVACARALALRGAAAAAAVVLIAGGGCLTVLTGLGKPAGVMCVAIVWFAAAAVRAARGTGSPVMPGVVLALALLTHRSAVLLIPAWLVTLALAARAGAPLRAAGWARALAVPALVGLLFARRLVRTLLGFDVTHHLLGADAARLGGWLPALVAPLHLLDIANALVALVPLAPLLPLLWPGAVRAGGAAPERPLFVALALAALAAFVLVHPQQGHFRDWDVFAPAAVMLSLALAHAAGTLLRGRPGLDALAVPLVALTLLPTVQWLALAHDPPRALARVHAYADGPPARPEAARALTYDFLATRAFRLGRWPAAAAAFDSAAALAPHRRLLLMRALARSEGGDHRGARAAYEALLARDSSDALAWLGLGGAALRLGDSARAAEAHARLAAFAADSARAWEIRRHLSFFPGVWPAAHELPAAPGPR